MLPLALVCRSCPPAVVPLCEELGFEVPAHINEATGEAELDFELPCQYDPDERRWLYDEHITWDEVWERWRSRGPMNVQFVESVRASRASIEALIAA